jgi:Zn-dependent M28 family amino/carboxypeptidase
MAGRVSRQSVAALAAAFALAGILLSAGALTPEQQAVVSHISADSLRGNLSFLASDLLEGRATPSRGLDVAAEYIAAQFRRTGLEPVGDHDYFQTANLSNGGLQNSVARNVAGLLRGSDPALADTYVILSAHYDHIGMRPPGDDRGSSDRIYNGANDDGSGTVSVIEIASALAAAPVHPKRSILFLTFYGEEKGLWGSHYYVDHPLEPLNKTVAEVNLEQVGRTDAKDGRHVGVAFVTGYDYSNLGAILDAAAQPTGVGIKPIKGDYYERADNLWFARAGVPAHTIAVAAEFSDYHGVGDEWQKIDYENMANVDRAVALGVLALASDAAPPAWNGTSSAGRKYAEAAKKLHP